MNHIRALIKLEEERFSSCSIPVKGGVESASVNFNNDYNPIMSGLELLPSCDMEKMMDKKSVTIAIKNDELIYKCSDCFQQFKNEKDIKVHLLNENCFQEDDFFTSPAAQHLRFYEHRLGEAIGREKVICTVITERVNGLVAVTKMKIPTVSTSSLSNCYHVARGRGGCFSFDVVYNSKKIHIIL